MLGWVGLFQILLKKHHGSPIHRFVMILCYNSCREPRVPRGCMRDSFEPQVKHQMQAYGFRIVRSA